MVDMISLLWQDEMVDKISLLWQDEMVIENRAQHKYTCKNTQKKYMFKNRDREETERWRKERKYNERQRGRGNRERGEGRRGHRERENREREVEERGKKERAGEREYLRPEVICHWTKEQEPGLHQRKTDIVILQETWYKGDGSTGCPLGYRELVVPSTKLPGVKQGRDSVDKLIWYRADLTHSIKLIKTGTFYIWLEIQKEIMLNREKCPPVC